MLSDLLTIVIPTRDRPDLLEKSLASIFDKQQVLPRVIVSNNSVNDQPAIGTLRKTYPFTYVRQSGKLGMTEHHNVCVGLTATPWVLLLHDDDEISPGAMDAMDAILPAAGDAGAVLGAVEFINRDGASQGRWTPDAEGRFSGEEIVLRLGLDYRISPPSIIWNAALLQATGGFQDVAGIADDQSHVLRVAYSPGVVLTPNVIGRYRLWTDQTTGFSTPQRAESMMDCIIGIAEGIRSIGVSSKAADQLVDYTVWWGFRHAIPLFAKHPLYLSSLRAKCERITPEEGVWKSRIKREAPFLFWRPRRISILCVALALTLIPYPIRQQFKQGGRAVYSLIRRIGNRLKP